MSSQSEDQPVAALNPAQRLDRVLKPWIIRVSWCLALLALFLTAGLLSGNGESMIPGIRLVLLGVALLAIVLRLLLLTGPEIRVATGLLLVVVIGILYCLETFLQLNPLTLDARYRQSKVQGISFDSRDKATVIEDLRSAGMDAWPTFSPRYYLGGTWSAEVTPLAGLSNRRVVLGNEGGFWVTYDNDEHGFNNRPGGYSGEVDLAVLGDSFAIGAMVERADNFATQLAEPGCRVLNFGRYGVGTFLEWCIFREYIVPLRPRRVLLFVYWDDALQAWWEEKCPRLVAWRNPEYTADLIHRQDEIDRALLPFLKQNLDKLRTPARSVWRISRDFLSLDFCRRLLGLVPAPPGPPEPPEEKAGYRFFGTLLMQMQQWTRSWGGEFAVVYLPSFYRAVPSPEVVVARLNQVHDAITEELRIGKIPFLDLDGWLATVEDPLQYFPWRQHNHYNEAGYKALSLRIKEFLDTL